MNYKKTKMKNYDLYFIKTKKFKTISASFYLTRETTKEDEVFCAILKKVLLYATNKYHNLDELCRAGMDLYDPSVSIGAVTSGLDRTFYLETTFVNEKYTEKGMNKKSLEYAISHLWDPYAKEGTFDNEIFEICQHEYIENMRRIKDDPDRFTEERIWEEMNLYSYGEMTIQDCIDYASKLTAKDLYNYYLSLFDKDSLTVFLAGDFDDEEIKEVLDRNIKGNFKPNYKLRPLKGEIHKEKMVTEKAHTEQSKLAIGLRYIDLTDFERKYVSLVYNNILGSGWNSKLNKTVRLDNSLCYYIYAVRRIPFNVAFIYSGVDAASTDKTIKLIKQEINNMHTNISASEIDRVKEIYNNALTEIEDNQMAIISNVISQVMSDTDSIDERRKNIAKVTIDDVKNMASKVNIDTIYLLEGDADNEENL